MKVEKSKELQTAESNLQLARERVEKATAAALAASSALAKSTHAKFQILGKSAAGEAVTAAAMLESEAACRDAETINSFSKAAQDGAESTLANALAEFRPLARTWFEERYRDLMGHRAAIAREADALLNQARSKLDEVDALVAEFSKLRLESREIIPNADTLPITFLSIPRSGSGVLFRVVLASDSFETDYRSIARALGHG